MSTQIKKELQLEIGHVLFMEIVDYSTRLIDEQRALRDTLNQIVRSTNQFKAADATGTLIKSPTGRRYGARLPQERRRTSLNGRRDQERDPA